MNTFKRFEDKDLDGAIQKASAFFQVEQDELEVEVLDSGSSGIFGLGGRNTIIEAGIKNHNKELVRYLDGVVRKMLELITDNPEVTISINGNRADVIIDDADNSGLIIGKDGQNIAAFEYVINRIVARGWPDKIYVQLDAGDYRTRQDEALKHNARFLADKVKESGRAQTTKPLSSYHRRLVHVELQGDDQIITRSRGEGRMKRVLIALNKKRDEQPESQ